MPNNVTNTLTVSGKPERREALFEAIKVDEYGLGTIDFTKIIPAPDDLYQGDVGDEERKRYGDKNWYDWNMSNWGTQWNAYGQEGMTDGCFDGASIAFLTAEDDAHPVIVRLAEMYPDLDFTYWWSDESLGENLGRRKYHNGKEIECFIPERNSAEAYEFAAEVWQVELKDEGYFWNTTTGNYEFIPERIGMELK